MKTIVLLLHSYNWEKWSVSLLNVVNELRNVDIQVVRGTIKLKKEVTHKSELHKSYTCMYNKKGIVLQRLFTFKNYFCYVRLVAYIIMLRLFTQTMVLQGYPC